MRAKIGELVLESAASTAASPILRAMSMLRGLAVWLVPPALLVAVLAVLALVRAESLGAASAAELAGFSAAVVAAALHRPAIGGLLGLGTLALPPALARLPPFWIGVIVTAGAVVAEALRRWLERRRQAPLPERRSVARLVARAALAGLGALAAAAVWDAAGAPGAEAAELSLAVALAALAFVVPAVLFEVATRRALRGESAREILTGLLPLGWEMPGFVVGALVVAVGARASWPLAAGSLATAALLAAEAARQALGAEAAERNLAASARVTRAGASLVAGGSEFARLARRIFDECRGIVPFAYAQLEMASPESGETRFWADAESEPREGDPDPPSYPPPLPGFHRREPWRILDRELLAEGGRRARLCLWCDPRRLEATAEASLDALAPQMAASVRGALLDREATTDRLTGAATRRALERRLIESFAAAVADGSSLALVLADLDHFKRINDRHGHAAGDRALEAVARVLVGPNRGREFCARYGGEEFVLVLEEASGELALEVAERLRRRIEELEVETPIGPLALSMSFGVAAFPELSVRSPEELLELADGALYTAKKLGRNLVLLDLGGGRMRTGAGGTVEVAEPPPVRAPVFFA